MCHVDIIFFFSNLRKSLDCHDLFVGGGGGEGGSDDLMVLD